MRERITIVHPPDTGIAPDDLHLDATGLKAPDLEAVREHRLTLALENLPVEIVKALQHLETLQVRWATSQAYRTLDPFSSRLSPGLHVSFTPLKGHDIEPSEICSLLKLLGPLDCMSSENFTFDKRKQSKQPTYYFYENLKNLDNFAQLLRTGFCHEIEGCDVRAQELGSAASLDFTYDSETETSKLAVLWPLAEQSMKFDTPERRRSEVGIFAKGSPPHMGSDDIGLGGILAVLGESKTPSTTLFNFASIHRSTEDHFTSRFLEPTGLHPTLQISVSNNKPPVKAPFEEVECKPYAYLTLPKTIFADRYQLDDKLFMASKNLTAARYTSQPVDLEAPAYTTKTWGSKVLLELAPPETSQPTAWTAEVPLHLRYLEPSASGYREIEVPYPVVFWSCYGGVESDFGNKPFDRWELGYDELFESQTVFWQVHPRPVDGNTIVSRLNVPVLKEGADSWVGVGTAAVVTLGFAWILFKLVMSYGRFGIRDDSTKESSGKKTQ